MKLKPAALFILSTCWYLYTTVWQPSKSLAAPSDFLHYYRAGQAVLAGQSPFSDPEFLYPPLIAFLAAPFALTDYVTARWLWFAISQASLLTAAWILWRVLGRDWFAACLIAFVWALGGAASESLSLGQASPILLLLLTIAYTQTPRARGTAAGLGWSLKYIPGALIMVFILERNRSALAAVALTLSLTFLLPWLVLLALPGAPAPVSANYWMGTPALLSWSIPSTVLRALDRPAGNARLPYDWEFGNVAANLHLDPTRRAASLAAVLVTLAAGVAALLIVSKGRLTPQQAPWASAALLSLTLAAAPVCWSHYQVLQYPGLALLLNAAFRSRNWLRFGLGTACAALLYPLPVAVLAAYYHAHAGWTAASPVTLYFWTSVPPLASLGLFCLYLQSQSRPNRFPARSSP